MIDRYHLRYFLAVIDQGNFSKAAAVCNVSQPTLSVGISKLETTLGRTLFHRTNRRVEITDAGARLATYARRIESDFAHAEAAVAGLAMPNTLRIGILVTIPKVWIEQYLLEHRVSGKNDRVEIVEGRERELQDRLARGRIDIALTILRPRTLGEQDLLFSEGYSLAMASTHPLADRNCIAAEDLANEPMIVRRRCELLSETSQYFTARGVRPFFPARTTSDDRALGYVRAGLGVTVMPDCFTQAGIVRPLLENFHFTRDIGLLYSDTLDKDEIRSRSTIRDLVTSIERARGA